MTVFEAQVLRYWQAGADSVEIAIALDVPEATVCRVLAAVSDRRHALRKREAQRA